MTYLPLTEDERVEMLATIGASSVSDLFTDVPETYRYPPIQLPVGQSELDVKRALSALSEANMDLDHTVSFLGAGAYQHFVPSIVNHILLRGEFYTAYTPYQPEISQGTLQAIFEYQTMICALTGLEVANASHYDGATALAEGILMAYNVLRGKRHKAVLAPTIHPEYKRVVDTYVQGMEIDIVQDTQAYMEYDLDKLGAMIDDDTFCVVVQNPDFFGTLSDPQTLQRLADIAHKKRALLIVAGYPIALALIQPPGTLGADIAVGDAQPLGNSLNFGGPYIGYFACRKKHMHKMAGRLVGQTVDVDGKRGFVLTMSAREQHIRRERATSNICTNQSLCALAAAVYMSGLGKDGLTTVAKHCFHKAHYLASQIEELPGFELLSRQTFFNEFVIQCPRSVAEINQILKAKGIIGGLDLARFYPTKTSHMLICTTEIHSKEMLDDLVAALKEAGQ